MGILTCLGVCLLTIASTLSPPGCYFRPSFLPSVALLDAIVPPRALGSQECPLLSLVMEGDCTNTLRFIASGTTRSYIDVLIVDITFRT